jgi:hypothetical protein
VLYGLVIAAVAVASWWLWKASATPRAEERIEDGVAKLLAALGIIGPLFIVVAAVVGLLSLGGCASPAVTSADLRSMSASELTPEVIDRMDRSAIEEVFLAGCYAVADPGKCRCSVGELRRSPAVPDEDMRQSIMYAKPHSPALSSRLSEARLVCNPT